MVVVVQRVLSASVAVAGATVAHIGRGYLLLVGVGKEAPPTTRAGSSLK